ncbi:hypothetical protein QJS10_CPB13g00683 [Acorus calamus]|uniref:Rx N-terminal domain-containing protein n=1 Tax=Acorus calamus TaxID=4465 RepID=A0AAV9DLJ0_ACOCL|nr:hypothetical protein QJS10_CPB13g00683 [Acorus calamus]
MGPETLVAGAFISASVSILLNKASSPAFKKIAKLYHMKSELKKLNRTLKRIEAVLKDADMVQVKEENLKLWLRELKDLAYHAEDVLEEFEFDAKEREPEGRADSFRVPFDLFVELKYLRVLDLSYSKIEDVPPSISNLKHLRFLDLCYTSIKCLPESLSKLSNLQTIKLKQSDQLPALPSGMSNLVNLRHLEPNADLASQIARIGQLTCLQKLDAFSVSKECGYKVGELKDMNELREGIIIQNLEMLRAEKRPFRLN